MVRRAALSENGRPTEKARATRAALIDAAAESFVEHGYGGMSVRDLAQRLNMTTGAIYGNFKSKANLLGEAIRARIVHDLEERGGRRYTETELAEYLAHSFRDYRKRGALRALLVEGAAAARVDDDVRGLLPDVMLAYEMDGAPLPQEHGAPVRVVIPDMYGYKNVKWVERIELVPRSSLGYWEQRGYDVDAWVNG